jgi:hypothetical protein
MTDVKDNTEFVVNGDRAYPVRLDTSTGKHIVYDPRDPASPAYTITRSTNGNWSIGGAIAPAGHAAPGQTLPIRYTREPNGALLPDTDHAGIYMDETGQRYLKDDKFTYPCRYEGGTWRIVQPDDPAKPGIPVRPDEHANWSINREVGLPGGGDEKSPRFTELTNRKRSLELQIVQSENRWRQLDSQYQELKSRWEHAERNLLAFRPEDLNSPAATRASMDAIALEREVLYIQGERDKEQSTYNYAKLDLRSVEGELASLNLSTW